jgi:putative NADH-flavin reductase
MRVLVVGGAGRTGRLVVERALAHGHEVTAFVHRAPLDLSDSRLATVTGDALVFDDVMSAVAGHDAVVVAVGGGRGKLHEPLIANVVHAMAEQGVRKLAVLSAAGTFARKDPNLSVAFRLMVSVAMRPTYDDLEAMERRVMASDLDWTIVRPVGLTDAPAAGDYRISRDGSLLPKATRISRADVAGMLLKAIETESYWRAAVVIGD